MRDDEINQAIDRAVREIVDVEPPADLRARVMDRIDRPAVPAFRWTLRVVAPIAAAAILIASLVMWLPSRHTTVVPVESARSAHSPSSPVGGRPPSSPSTHGTPRTMVARVEPARLPRRSSVRAAMTTSIEPPGTEVAPLDPIAPIRVTAVTPSDITPKPVVVEPLAPIAEVQIAPLTPPNGRH